MNSLDQLTYLNCLPFILWVQEPEGKIIYGNNHFLNFFNIKNEENSNIQNLTEYLPPEIVNLMKEDGTEKSIKTFEIKIKKDNLNSVWLEIHKGTITTEIGTIVGSVYIAHDITEKKSIEKKQLRIKNQLKALIKILTNPTDTLQTDDLISMSIQTIFDFFSDFRISYFQIENNSLILKHSVEPNHFSSIQFPNIEVEQLSSYASMLQIQGFLYYNDINERDLYTILPIGTNYSVTSLVDLPINFEHNVVAILRIDTEEPHQWLDDEIQSFAEIAKNLSIIIQKNIYQQQVIEYEKNLLENYQQLEKYAIELKELKELYQDRSEELFINRELLEDHAFSINVLNQQLFEKEELIEESNKQLENALKERDKFFSIIAHDLRSPLSSFLGMTKMINEQSEQFTKEELVEISGLIHKNAETLYSLIENLLNWSRLQRDVIIVEPQVINVKVSTDVAIAIYKEAIINKEIELIEKVQSNHFIYCDLNMFESILRNLLSNAVKFTPRGGKIYVTSNEYNHNYICIAITDTGIGMNQEFISKLFRIDEKVSRPGTEGEPSTGLGLILCKELIEKNEGKLNVISSEGVGTKFEIILPKNSVYDDIID